MLGLIQCKIQSGVTAATTDLAVAITPVADVAKCLLFANGRSGYASAYFNSVSSIQIKSSASGIVNWQLIEFGGAV